MATAKVAFNPEHDMAAIRWDRSPADWPTDAVNQALQRLYQDDNLAPYIYLVYDRDGSTRLGMLLAGNFDPANDAEIRQVWSDIVNRDEVAAETDGPYAHFEVQA